MVGPQESAVTEEIVAHIRGSAGRVLLPNSQGGNHVRATTHVLILGGGWEVVRPPAIHFETFKHHYPRFCDFENLYVVYRAAPRRDGKAVDLLYVQYKRRVASGV